MTGNSKNLPRIIVDTSTLFSAFYNRKGNEARLLELADQEKCEIIILDYVMEEIDSVFRRYEIDIELVYDLLQTYHNITISSLEYIKEDEVSISNELIKDILDRPIFIFSRREIASNDRSYLITGDKGFFSVEVRKELGNRVIHTVEALDMIMNLDRINTNDHQ